MFELNPLVRAAVALVVGAPALVGQGPELAWRALPGAAAVAIGVRFEHGVLGPERAGPPGAAAVLANCRLLAVREAVPRLLSGFVHVDDEQHCIVGVLPAEPDLVIAFVFALFADGESLADDQIAREVARLALAADDAAFLFPGDVLHGRVRAATMGRGAPRGDAEALLALTPGRVRELLRVPVAYAAAILGNIGPVQAVLQAWPWPQPEAAGPRAPMPSFATAPTVGSEVHARVDAPFVVAAFPIAASVSRPALAVGLEVLRARAMRIGSGLAPRGSELLARAPTVAWSWLAGDHLVRCHRRGFDPVQLLPGEVLSGAVDAAMEARATAAELDSLLAAARSTPPTAAEVSTAQHTLLVEFGFEVAADREPDVALLPAWTVVQLLGPGRGIEPAAIAAVDAGSAHAALTAVLAAAAVVRHTLLPAPSARKVFRPRS